MAKIDYFIESELAFVGKLKDKRFQDLTSQNFGRLTVIGFGGATTKSQWYCKCDCGNITKVWATNLQKGTTISCGCFRKERTKEVHTTHGYNTKDKASRTYRTWTNMLDRCQKHNSISFQYYGERGIKVCDRWQVFENFLEDMGEKPVGLTLDRIENDKGYYKENCRWVTDIEQQNNRRNNRFLTFNDKIQTFAQWERELGLKRSVISGRLKNGWSIEKALTTQVRIKKCKKFPTF